MGVRHWPRGRPDPSRRPSTWCRTSFAPLVWLGRGVNHAASGHTAGGGGVSGQTMRYGVGRQGGHPGGIVGGTGSAVGAATAALKAGSTARPQAAASACATVARAPKPFGAMPECRAIRMPLVLTGPSEHADGFAAGVAASRLAASLICGALRRCDGLVLKTI